MKFRCYFVGFITANGSSNRRLLFDSIRGGNFLDNQHLIEAINFWKEDSGFNQSLNYVDRSIYTRVFKRDISEGHCSVF